MGSAKWLSHRDGSDERRQPKRRDRGKERKSSGAKEKVGFRRAGVCFYLCSSGTKDYMLIYLTCWHLELWTLVLHSINMIRSINIYTPLLRVQTSDLFPFLWVFTPGHLIQSCGFIIAHVRVRTHTHTTPTCMCSAQNFPWIADSGFLIPTWASLTHPSNAIF